MTAKKALILIALISVYIHGFSQRFYENREDIPEQYTWNFRLLFDDWKQWKRYYNETEKLTEAFVKRDTLKTAEELYKTLYTLDTLSNRIRKLSLYAMMKTNVNQKDEFAGDQRYKAMSLKYKLHYKRSWLYPCLQKLNSDSVFQWIIDYPKLKEYEFMYRSELRDKAHVISEDKENTISRFDYAFYTFNDAYEALINLDNDLPKMSYKDSIIQLNTTKYFDILRNETDRNIRRKAYNKMNTLYNSNKHTIAALVNGACNMSFAYAKSYNFESTLAYHIDYDSIPVELYANLLTRIKADTKPLQKYHELRAKALKTEDYSVYDKRFSIASPLKNYNIELALELIRNSVAPLGEDYAAKVVKILNNRQIDYFENKNKLTSVAYTTYAYKTPPFILTSYGNGLKDVYDLIHELGHAVHAVYSIENQPISSYESTIFIDEVTSTFNELLLTDYLLNLWAEGENRLYLLEIAVNNIEYYFQSALKADFILQVFNRIESDEDITASVLDEMYAKTCFEYYGNSIHNIDSSSWCSYGIPDFYDYQYVSSMIASLNFFDRIIINGEIEALDDYFTLLKSGGNDFPLNQLKRSGIDLTDKKNYSVLAKYMNVLVDMYEKELIKNGLIE